VLEKGKPMTVLNLPAVRVAALAVAAGEACVKHETAGRFSVAWEYSMIAGELWAEISCTDNAAVWHSNARRLHEVVTAIDGEL